jgi:4-hydroxy-tetrahydrodipicolinate synthase
MKIQGIISAMITPFTKNGEFVDFDKVGPLADRLVRGGVHGLFPCGTTGEGLLMSPEERMEVIEEVVQAVGKRTKVIAHTGAMDTATTIELTRHAQECGAHGAAIVAPGFYTYDEAALAQFYISVAKAVKDFPIMLYNIPGCAKNALSASLIIRLAETVGNIVGIKDSSGSMPLLTQLLGNVPAGFQVVNGADDYGYQAFLAGAAGAVSGTSNVSHELYLSVYNNVVKGNLKKAWQEQVRLEKLCRILEYGKNIAVFKEGLRLRGFDAGYVRPPQRELTAAEKKNLAKQLEAVGVL